MKKYSFLLLLFISAASFAQDNQEITSASGKQVTIDGVASEWSLPFPYSDRESGISWSAMNDREYLYICIQSVEQALQQKLMRAGMYVMISSGGKDKIKTTVNFPLKSQDQGQRERPTDGEGRIDRSQIRQQFIESSTEMKLKGFATTNGTVPNKSETGIAASFSWEAQFLMTYELRIPLAELYGDSYSMDNLVTPLAVKIVVNPLPKPAPVTPGTQDPVVSTSRSGGGGRGSRGSGPPSGSGTGQGQPRSEMYIPTTVKGDILLNRNATLN